MLKKNKFIFYIFIFLISTQVLASIKAHKPTIVMVHGALLTSGSWMPVQSYLQNKGYNVVTLDVPGRAEDNLAASDITFDMATQKVCNVVELQNGPVVLVGHSQAGALITQALEKCGDKIKSLVYVAAVVPLNGEQVFQMLSPQDNANFDRCATLDESTSLYKINPTGPIKEMFMADASRAQSERAIHYMTDEPSHIGDGTLHYDTEKFKAIPKFYIKTLNDKIISAETQTAILSKVKMEETYSMSTGHSPFVSQPQQLGKYITHIVDKVSES